MGQPDRRAFLRAAAVSAGFFAACASSRGICTAPLRWPRPLRVATLSDSQLQCASTNPRFSQRLERAIANVNALRPAPNLAIFGGNLCRMGGADAMRLGARSLAKLNMPVVMVAGEHDWYEDMGHAWQQLFGPATYSFDHLGVHVVVLMNLITGAQWHAAPMTPAERMHTAAQLSAAKTGRFCLGQKQLQWLASDLKAVRPQTPVLVVSHGPLFDWYAPWNFGTSDGLEALRLLQPFAQVTLLHGHCQQAMAQPILGRASFGMVSTAWALPPAPTPASWATKQLRAAVCGEGVGYGELVIRPSGPARYRYHLADQAPLDAPWPVT